MASRHRDRFLNPFGLSFLDVMSCGLGAAVLLFLIIDHNLSELAHASESGEADVQILEQSIQEEEDQIAERQRQLQQLQRDLKKLARERVAAITTQAELQASKPRASDTSQLEKEVRRQKERVQQAKTSQQVRTREGEGQRQYVAGFRVEGRRILILLDRSASMMDAEIATIIRNKFLPASVQKQSHKWRWARSILEWVLAHLPEQARYQVWGFSSNPMALFPGRGWLMAGDAQRMQEVLDAIQGWVPSGGTRLDTTFKKIATLNPRPDAIYLITDGLPTQGSTLLGLKKKQVSANERMGFFHDATKGIKDPPFNVILLPLEGDPQASGAWWGFAMKTHGQFLAPAEDWP